MVNENAANLQELLKKANCKYETKAMQEDGDSTQDENGTEEANKTEEEKNTEEVNKTEEEKTTEEANKTEEEKTTEETNKPEEGKTTEETKNPQNENSTGNSSSSSTIVIDQSVTNNDNSNNTITNNTVNNTVINNMVNADTGNTENQNTKTDVQMSPLKKGNTFVVENLKYKVLTSKTAAFIGVDNKAIKVLTIPGRVKVGTQSFKITEVQKKACYNNKTINTIVVGNNVVSIKDSAFEGCSRLKSITIGTSIKNIGKRTFAKDKKIKEMVIKGKKLKTIGKNAFWGVPTSISIHAPKSKTKVYKKLINKK